MSMVSRWPVVVTVSLQDDEIATDGRITEAGADRAFAAARRAYLEQCTSVQGLFLEVRECTVIVGEPLDGATEIRVATGVVEIFPDSFTMTARMRPTRASEIAADATCLLSTGDELPTACRDEFIAKAHAAQHFA
jgi:hypothetical protein